LVNNAFTEDDWTAPFEGFSAARWRPAFEVNLFGTLEMTRAVVTHMKRQRSGSVVMISTLSIRNVNPVFGGYCASKGALTTATHVLAKELGPYGIRVNQVAPGHIWGESLRRYFAFLAERRGVTARQIHDEIAAQNALGRIPTSEEIARAVLFFASDMSRAITGQTLDVNCGRTSH
ncbi:MAG: short-chain dehydrogenase, partial [Acidimicrobiia bacterium]